MIIKNSILVLILSVFISCGSEQEGQAEGSDSTATMQGSCTCEGLQEEIASLRAEINSLKTNKKKSSGTSSANTSTQKSTSNAGNTTTQKSASTTGKVVGKRDSDGSIRCSVVTSGQRCSHRTFSKNGLCQRHGGNEPIER